MAKQGGRGGLLKPIFTKSINIYSNQKKKKQQPNFKKFACARKDTPRDQITPGPNPQEGLLGPVQASFMDAKHKLGRETGQKLTGEGSLSASRVLLCQRCLNQGRGHQTFHPRVLFGICCVLCAQINLRGWYLMRSL